LVGIGLVFACTGDETTDTPSTPDATSGIDVNQPKPDSSTNPPVDAGSDTGTVADTGADTFVPFTPAALGSRLVLWLEGDAFTDIGGSVKWPDKSGLGNDAFQDAATRMPAIVDASTDGAVNGHGVVRFAGNQFLAIADNVALQWAPGDFGFYIVMRHTNGTNDYGIGYAKWSDVGGLGFPGFFMWASYPQAGATGYVTRLDTQQAVLSDGGLNDGVARLVAARKVAGNLELRVQGNQVGMITDAGFPDASAFNAPGIPAVIGGRQGAIQALKGDIAEIIAVKGTLTDAEQTSVETYLKAKYGF